MPFSALNQYYLEYVIAHERYHLRRGDNIIKALSFFILAVHWFDPFCWVAFFLMNRDMEMSCDEKVISQINRIKKIYSTALLSFAANKKFPSPSPLCFGEGSIKGRIKNILKYKKPGVFVSVLAMVICIAVALICVDNLFYKMEHPDDVSTNMSPNPYDYIDKGHLMKIVMNDIIGDEAIDIFASTGQEYFDAWSKQAFKLYNENSNSQSYYQTTYPYGYRFVTHYSKTKTIDYNSGLE